MHTTSKPTRRDFIEKAATLGALGLSTRFASAQRGKPTSPNERLHLGLIGCGGMGRGNLGNCAKHPDVVVTAACDVQKSRREAVAAKYKDTCKPYADFREMLQRDDVDAVIVATPPHWHCLIGIAVAEAKKDLYLQKPMTLHLAETFAVRNAVRKHDIICQIGTQIHASENYRRIVERIQAGQLGDIGVVRTFHVLNQSPDGIGHAPDNKTPEGVDWDFWCGPAPLIPYNKILAANAYNHGSWMKYSGGWTPGMAPHIIDLPIWAMGLKYPLATYSSGGRFFLDDDGDAYDNQEILWRYPDCTLHWFTSLTNSYGYDLHAGNAPRRRLGIYFCGSNGTLFGDYGKYEIVPEGQRMEGKEPPPPSIPRSPGHEREWLDSIKSRKKPSCNPEYHVRLDAAVNLGLLSLELGRSVRFDPTAEKIVGDREAAEKAKPVYRDPWEFPEEYYGRHDGALPA